MARRRLDAELVQRGLAPSRRSAQLEIAAGRVTIDGDVADKASRAVPPGADVALIGPALRYVSRAGLKLEHALDTFAIDVTGRIGLDAGSSTGGFTDCLLQRGAAAVIAVDVGTDQLHPRLRSNPWVTVREQTDIRHLSPETLDVPVDLVVADLSFISLRLVFAPLAALAAGKPVVALVKPQFEAGRVEAARAKGVIADPQIWRRVLGEVTAEAADHGLRLRGITPSPIRGSAGNVEFTTWWQADDNSLNPVDAIPAALAESALDAVVATAETSDV